MAAARCIHCRAIDTESVYVSHGWVWQNSHYQGAPPPPIISFASSRGRRSIDQVRLTQVISDQVPSDFVARCRYQKKTVVSLMMWWPMTMRSSRIARRPWIAIKDPAFGAMTRVAAPRSPFSVTEDLMVRTAELAVDL